MCVLFKGLLRNPGLFLDVDYKPVKFAFEYLELCYSSPPSDIRFVTIHMKNFFREILKNNATGIAPEHLILHNHNPTSKDIYNMLDNPRLRTLQQVYELLRIIAVRLGDEMIPYANMKGGCFTPYIARPLFTLQEIKILAVTEEIDLFAYKDPLMIFTNDDECYVQPLFD